MGARHWLGLGVCSGDEDSESKETLSRGGKASLTVPPSARCRLRSAQDPPTGPASTHTTGGLPPDLSRPSALKALAGSTQASPLERLPLSPRPGPTPLLVSHPCRRLVPVRGPQAGGLAFHPSGCPESTGLAGRGTRET